MMSLQKQWWKHSVDDEPEFSGELNLLTSILRSDFVSEGASLGTKEKQKAAPELWM